MITKCAFLLSAALAVFAYSAMGQARTPGRALVVATTGMIADAARVIGGDLIEVRALMGPGVDPHSYRQTRTDIVAMTRADLVLWHGLFLEAQMESFFHDLAEKRNVVAVAEGVDRALLLSHDAYADKFDPHLWMDPMLWRHVVLNVRDALIATLPDRAEVMTANAETYLSGIARLAGYAKTALATVPEHSRILVTAHDAFGYFGAGYGFEVMGIQGISTSSEAGLNRIGELVGVLVDRRIGAVFVESSVSDRSIRALIEGAAARGHQVIIGGELFSDAMGAPGAYEGTYPGMIDHNVTTIANALNGAAPDRGMAGRLAAGM